MAGQQKDVIYIDVDDEITGIIDKLRSSEGRIVALVLPKRATMLQSSVNMKLLKKVAADTKKRLVLITSEAGLLPLAGSVGLHVAKSLQSKPEIPDAPTDLDENEVDTLDEPKEDFDREAAAERPVGELAGLGDEDEKPTAKPELTPRPIPKSSEPDEAIELDNTPEAAAAAEVAKTDKKTKKPKDKSLKIPNFNKFRLRLIIGAVVLIALVVLWVIANNVLPKAKVTIATTTNSVNSNLTLTLSTSATSVDASSSTVPAHLQQTQLTESGQVATTGQQNNGVAATGSVTMTAGSCSGTQPADVPAGTGITNNNLNYVTQQDVSFAPTIPKGSHTCTWEGNNPTNITAQDPGSGYNVSNATFTISADPGVTATGSASGGTDNIVQTVTQTDINNATQKLASPNTAAAKTTLANALQQAGYYPITASFSAGTPSNSNSANVGDQATTVTVTQTTTYTMFGVHQSDIQGLLDSNLNSQINTTDQAIQNDGFSSASYSVSNQSSTGAQVSMQATGTAGPHLSANSLKTQIAGKKSGDVESTISNDPGVTSVQVHLSPFWVSTVPSKLNKITITFVSSNASKT